MPNPEFASSSEPGRLVPRRSIWSDSASITLLGAIAIGVPVTLLVSGAAAPVPSLTAAGVAVIAACAVAVARRLRGFASPIEPVVVISAASPVPATNFASLIDGFEDPMLIVAGGTPSEPGHQRFLFANAAARSLFHIQRDQGPLTTAIRAPDVLASVERVLNGGDPGTAWYESGGVQVRTWRVRVTPIPPSVPPRGIGESTLVLVTLRDETESKRNERTRADFLANASHELRTPLASLAGFIETLRGHARDDREATDRFLAIMHGQAERMRRLINDLMSLSRIELAEHVAPSGEVDISVAVIDVVDALTPMAGDRSVQFKLELPPNGSAIALGDRDQIVQVIQNLVENALKYAPDGGVVGIGVQAARAIETRKNASTDLIHLDLLFPDRADGTQYIVLQVHDAGRGIARANLQRLTERFYRVEGQKSGDHSGTGLGLAIVKHIVNRHRGGLAVESAEGVGTIFTVYLPIAHT